VDCSADQLRYARARGVCVQADAAALPFADGAFPTVLMVWIEPPRGWWRL
jgi:ubiquinone/menaquinone biosynthesis C-methylase UbiE